MIKLVNLLKEAEGEAPKCPIATQNIEVNLEHRQKAIDEYGYGPLNPNNPNIKFWKAKADEWQLDSIEEAKSSRCNNCAAFNITSRMLNCIEKGITSGEVEVPIAKKSVSTENTSINEFLSKDLNNLKSVIKKFKIKVSDSKVIKNIESIIDIQLIDPYANIKSTVDQIRDYFKTINGSKNYNEYLQQTFDQALYNSNLKKLAEGDDVVTEPETDDTEGAAKDAWDTIEAGKLGYCTFLKFKCAGSRTCDSWVVGGPIKDKK